MSKPVKVTGGFCRHLERGLVRGLRGVRRDLPVFVDGA
jgi:hypothetical protein